MALGLFKKPAAAYAPPLPDSAPTLAVDVSDGAADSARDILDLLELELRGMVRQIECAANQVAGGATSTATTLTTIRERADALTGRTRAAQENATSLVRAAGRNRRSSLIQSYARDIGNGNTVMMREIDVPISVRGRHWGGFRTAYKL